ncbi:hypothetical protein [Streptomyces bikiniensis]|uniref:hypothetical protein n=1 Tax=Streptomyces bikiniensis TaxID=1896 RepID=UPI0004BF6CB1|nr:hypothetical protein [Streptomyces bikiniensis]
MTIATCFAPEPGSTVPVDTWALSRTRSGFPADSSASRAGVTGSGPYVPAGSVPASFAAHVVKTWETTTGLFPSGQAARRSLFSFAYSVSNAAFHRPAASRVPKSPASLSTSALTLSGSLSRSTSTSFAEEPAASLIFAAYGSKGA